jgi:hypothetical protein
MNGLSGRRRLGSLAASDFKWEFEQESQHHTEACRGMRNLMQRLPITCVVLFVTFGAQAADHVLLTPDAVKWGPPPAAVMRGAPPEEFLKQGGFEVAVLSGDPSKPGIYNIRFRCHDGYRVAPH